MNLNQLTFGQTYFQVITNFVATIQRSVVIQNEIDYTINYRFIVFKIGNEPNNYSINSNNYYRVKYLITEPFIEVEYSKFATIIRTAFTFYIRTRKHYITINLSLDNADRNLNTVSCSNINSQQWYCFFKFLNAPLIDFNRNKIK